MCGMNRGEWGQVFAATVYGGSGLVDDDLPLLIRVRLSASTQEIYSPTAFAEHSNIPPLKQPPGDRREDDRCDQQSGEPTDIQSIERVAALIIIER